MDFTFGRDCVLLCCSHCEWRYSRWCLCKSDWGHSRSFRTHCLGPSTQLSIAVTTTTLLHSCALLRTRNLLFHVSVALSWSIICYVSGPVDVRWANAVAYYSAHNCAAIAAKRPISAAFCILVNTCSLSGRAGFKALCCLACCDRCVASCVRFDAISCLLQLVCLVTDV